MNIEFVDPVLPSRRAWGGVLALAAMAAGIFVAARVLEARTQALNEALQARRLAATRAVTVAAPRPPPPYEADALRALDRARLPEAQALAELEAVSVVGIALQSIDVNVAERTVSVELRSSNQAALEDYLDQLNAGLTVPAWRMQQLAATEGPGGAQASGDLTVQQGQQVVTLERRFEPTP